MAYEAISKAVKNKRSYRLSRLGLQGRVKESVFTMIHRDTSILKVDLRDGKILDYGD